MQSSHAPSAVAAVFDEPNLIADAGLVPVMRLAERSGLVELTEQAVRIAGAGNSGGANAGAACGGNSDCVSKMCVPNADPSMLGTCM